LTSLEKGSEKKEVNKPSRKNQALLVMQLRPRSRQGKFFFPKLEKDAKKKPHKEKTKDVSNQRKETARKKVPTKNSLAYDCRHQNLQTKPHSNKTLTI